MFRFACSEKTYLEDLSSRLLEEVGDHRSLVELNNDSAAPFGGIKEPPIICNLLSAIRLKGEFQSIAHKVPVNIDPREEGFEAQKKDKIQTQIQKIFRDRFCADKLPSLIGQKIAVTFGKCFWRQVVLDHNWFDRIFGILQESGIHVRFCWLRTIAGGWTTTKRMGEIHTLPCLFGCKDSVDELSHYMSCPILWNICNESYPGESSFVLEERISLRDPSIIKLGRLALACDIHHSMKNDNISCMPSIPWTAEPRVVQARASEFAKSLKHRCRSINWMNRHDTETDTAT